MANMHVENETFSLVKKNFREINSLVTSLVLISCFHEILL